MPNAYLGGQLKNTSCDIQHFTVTDSKAHDAVMNIYPGKTVKKKQCIGHVQKQVGNRLLLVKKR